jgi:hypothetical protein
MAATQRQRLTLRLPLGIDATSCWVEVAMPIAVTILSCATASEGSRLAPPLRAVAALALVALAVWLDRALSHRVGPLGGWVTVDDGGIRRVLADRRDTLAEFAAPFGLTVLASCDRARFRLAFTGRHGTKYLPVVVRGPEDAAAAPVVIHRAVMAPDNDVLGVGRSLSARDAERLIEHVLRRDPAALDRVILSAGNGEAVVLDRSELRIGPHRFDLSAPLEWRASLFPEAGGRVMTVNQATWIRQGDSQAVLVATISSEVALPRAPDAVFQAAGQDTTVRRAVLRDFRLLQATPGEAPPRELRRAIDRAFMLRIREALDRAPRAACATRPPQGPAREGRA